MVYTVTFNPSLDYIASVDNFTVGRVNRTNREIIFPGGKGINVSIVLHNLGMESTALGFVAGFTGKEIQRRVREFNICEKFIEITDGISRINVKLRSEVESEINGMGPNIDARAMEAFYKQLDSLKKGDLLVLAGSIPSVMKPTIYCDIMKYLEGRGINIVVDATGDLLVNVLQYHPFLIKPNNFELGEIFGMDNLRDKKQVIEYAKKLQAKGARNVLVSMAADGAVFVSENGEVLEAPAPDGVVKNSVGAGDSMVAGFLYGYLEKGQYKEAFRYGLCTGSASAFSDGMATKDDVLKLLDHFELLDHFKE